MKKQWTSATALALTAVVARHATAGRGNLWLLGEARRLVRVPAAPIDRLAEFVQKGTLGIIDALGL
jgi:hypothetical protein